MLKVVQRWTKAKHFLNGMFSLHQLDEQKCHVMLRDPGSHHHRNLAALKLGSSKYESALLAESGMK